MPIPDPELVLVDGEDRALGLEARAACHALPGRKHRAFAALLLDGEGRVLLAERAQSKLLWPGHWDGTVASHPASGEDYVAAGARRVREELGVDCELVRAGRFDYRVTFREVGVEDELCAALFGRLRTGARLAPDPSEIAAVRALAPTELLRELGSAPQGLCPWFFLVLLCAQRAARAPRGFAELFDVLREPDAEAAVRAGLALHFDASPDAAWRMLDDSGDAA